VVNHGTRCRTSIVPNRWLSALAFCDEERGPCVTLAEAPYSPILAPILKQRENHSKGVVFHAHFPLLQYVGTGPVIRFGIAWQFCLGVISCGQARRGT